ncbi:hypothetical protein EDB81DRAFT_824179, partial [Dactylonectria macrodidyma]
MGIWLVMPLTGVGTARTALCIGLIPAAESELRHSALFGYVLCIEPWVSRSVSHERASVSFRARIKHWQAEPTWKDFGSHLLRWQGSHPDGVLLLTMHTTQHALLLIGSCWSVPLCQLVQHTFNSLVPRRAEWPEVRGEMRTTTGAACLLMHLRTCRMPFLVHFL